MMTLPPGRKEYFDVCSKRENPFPSGRPPEVENRPPEFRDWYGDRNPAAGSAPGDESISRARERRGVPIHGTKPGPQRPGSTASPVQASSYEPRPLRRGDVPICPESADQSQSVDEALCAEVAGSQLQCAESDVLSAPAVSAQPEPVRQPSESIRKSKWAKPFHQIERVAEVFPNGLDPRRICTERGQTAVDGGSDGDPTT